MVHLIYDSRCASFEYEIAEKGYIIHGPGRIKNYLEIGQKKQAEISAAGKESDG